MTGADVSAAATGKAQEGLSRCALHALSRSHKAANSATFDVQLKQCKKPGYFQRQGNACTLLVQLNIF